jgi:tRNA threonylcarbamoyladenosine biosynthesis protein TsaB
VLEYVGVRRGADNEGMHLKANRYKEILLAIDNSLGFLNLALAIDGKFIEERHGTFEKQTSELMSVKVRQFVADHNHEISDVDALVVTLGPGSFTGIRVALAFAKGLSSGLGIHLVGVSTLDVLAYPFRYLEGEYVCPLIDAKKGEVFLALYRISQGKLERCTEYQSVRPAAVADVVIEPCVCFGSGLGLCDEKLARIQGIRLVKDDFQRVRGETLLRLGMEARAAGVQRPVVPIYGRRSEAEIKFNVTIS